MRTVDEVQARIRALVQEASDVYHYGGEEEGEDRRPGYPDFTQLTDDIAAELQALREPPYRLEVKGGVTGCDLRLNFAFRSLTYTWGETWKAMHGTGFDGTAAAVVYLDECSFLAEAFLAIDAPGAEQLGLQLAVDANGVPTELGAVLVRVEISKHPSVKPRLVVLDVDGWGGDERQAGPYRPHRELGEIPYSNLVFHLEAQQINAVTYDLAGEWQPEEIELARTAVRRHLRLGGKTASRFLWNRGQAQAATAQAVTAQALGSCEICGDPNTYLARSRPYTFLCKHCSALQYRKSRDGDLAETAS